MPGTVKESCQWQLNNTFFWCFCYCISTIKYPLRNVCLEIPFRVILYHIKTIQLIIIRDNLAGFSGTVFAEMYLWIDCSVCSEMPFGVDLRHTETGQLICNAIYSASFIDKYFRTDIVVCSWIPFSKKSSYHKKPFNWFGKKIVRVFSERHFCTLWLRSPSRMDFSFCNNVLHSYTPTNICLDKDVLKTSFVFVFRRRLDQDQHNVLFIRLQGVFKTFSRRLQDVFKTSCKNVFKTSSRRLQDVFKTSSRHLQDLFKTFWRHLQDVFKTSCKDLFKMFSRRIIKLNCSC